MCLFFIYSYQFKTFNRMNATKTNEELLSNALFSFFLKTYSFLH